MLIKVKLYSIILSVILTFQIHAEEYISCKLWGQLGNQITLISTTLALAWENNAIAVFPDLDEVNEWNIPHNREHIFFRLNSILPDKLVLKEKVFGFNDSINYEPNVLLKGWSIKLDYFDRHAEKLREIFAPSDAMQVYLNEKYDEILNVPNAVGIQIRVCSKGCYPFTGWKYYEEAMELFPEDSVFVISSDRISWVKKHFSNAKLRKVIFLDEDDYIIDFFILSKCKNNIIGNSTFGYWSAYLNSTPDKKVVAPSLWLSPWDKRTYLGFPQTYNVYPKDWIVLRVPRLREVPPDVLEHTTSSVDW